MSESKPPFGTFIRVGKDYFKKVIKYDRYGTRRENLVPWNVQEIIRDYGKEYGSNMVAKYDYFTVEPDNFDPKPMNPASYNRYIAIPFTPRKGEHKVSTMIMKHIFGEQFDLGMKYMKVLLENPRQKLPILSLVSKERETGKTTFLNWLKMIYGDNMVMVDPDTFGYTFNSQYAYSNIIGVDETVINKGAIVEKIKALVTKDTIMVNMKHITEHQVDFYGKAIFCSNKEDDFMKIDTEEIRFWVRQVGSIPKENRIGDIFDKLRAEIPHFLWTLINELPDIDYNNLPSRQVFTTEEIRTGALSKVQQQSKSWLYWEIHGFLDDYFVKNPAAQEACMSVKDIMTLITGKRHVERVFVIRVMKHEFDKKTEQKRYTPLYSHDTDSAKVYTFTRDEFMDEEETEELKKLASEEGGLPF